MKKLFAIFALILMCGFPLIVSGCKKDYDDLSINIQDSYEIVLGESEDNSISITATVNGTKDDDSRKLSVTPLNENLISISTTYQGSGVSKIVLKALAPGNVKVVARTLEGNITKHFNVKITQPVSSFSTIDTSKMIFVRGSSIEIDPLDFIVINPVNATDKNFKVSLDPEQNTDGIGFADNILTIDKTSTATSVSFVVEAVDKENLLPQSFSVKILSDFTAVTEEEQSAGNFVPGNVVVYEKTDDFSSVDYISSLNIYSNITESAKKTVIVRVYGSELANTAVISSDNIIATFIKAYDPVVNASGIVIYQEFEYSVRFSDVVAGGDSGNIGFEIAYKNFNYSKTLYSIIVNVDYAPIKLLVNELQNNTNFTIYNTYSSSKKGLRLQFSVLPTAVSAEKSFVSLKNVDDSSNIFESLIFVRSNGVELLENDSIAANEIIYVKTRNNSVSGSFNVVVETAYSDEQVEPVHEVLTFNVLSGLQSLSFADNKNIELQLNSPNKSYEILFEATPADIDIAKLLIRPSNIFSASPITVNNRTADKVVFKTTITPTALGNDQFMVYSENGYEITKNVEVFNGLVSANIMTKSAYDSSAIGQRTIFDNNLYSVAVAIGSSVALDLTTNPSSCDYDISYEYSFVTEKPAVALHTFPFSHKATATTNDSLDFGQLITFGKIVPLKEGFTVIKMNIVSKISTDGTKSDGTPLVKYFYVEGYVPVKALTVSPANISLFSLDSVGAYFENLCAKTINVSVYPATATYGKEHLINWDYDTSGQYFSLEGTSGYSKNLMALSSPGGTISITVTVNEFSRVYTQTIKVNIVKATQISNITVANFGNEIYKVNTGDNGISFDIFSNIYPQDAKNKNLVYDFLDENKEVSSLLSFEKIDNSCVKVHADAGVGAFGYIRIAAEDCFQKDLMGKIAPSGTLGKNILLIPVTIANGLSKETAIHISSVEEFSQIILDKHYKIVGDLDLSGINFSGTFRGGLYADDSVSSVKLSNVLFNEVGEDGVIDGVPFEFAYSDRLANGAITHTNNGTIKNINIYGSITAQNVGAIAIENYGKISDIVINATFEGNEVGGIVKNNRSTGVINNCTFLGSIDAKKQASTIAVVNYGTISGCASLFGSGADATQNKIAITGDYDNTKIAGLVVVNHGKLLKSYIYCFNATPCIEGVAEKTSMAGVVHTNNGTISECFSDIPFSDSSAFIFNNAGMIANCYAGSTNNDALFAQTNSGTISRCYASSMVGDALLDALATCYSGLTTSTMMVSDWMSSGWDISSSYFYDTVWKVFTDGQFPILSEVQAPIKPDSFTMIMNPSVDDKYTVLSETELIMYYYRSKIYPLTIAEQAEITNKNTFSFNDIATLVVEPLNATTSIDMYELSITSGTNVVKIVGNKFVLIGTGKAEITISFKLDGTVSSTFTVYSLYPILDYNIYRGTSSEDPTNILNDQSIIYLKRTYSQAIYSFVKDSIILVDREIQIYQNDLKIQYYNGDPVDLGLGVITFNVIPEYEDEPEKRGIVDEYTCILALQGYDENADYAPVIQAIKDRCARTFTIQIYEGAEYITPSVTKLTMEPIDSVEFYVTTKTDVDVKENNNAILVSLLNNNNVDYSDFFSIIVKQENVINEVVNAEPTGFKIYTYKITISLLYDTLQIAGNYRIILNYGPDELATGYNITNSEVELTISEQEIQRIDYAHYYVDGFETLAGQNRVVVYRDYKPTNTLAPGSEGILEVSLFPSFSKVDRVEVVSLNSNGSVVSFQAYTTYTTSDKVGYTAVKSDYTAIENGLSLPSSLAVNGNFYIKTLVSTNIMEEQEFTIEIRVYSSANDTNPKTQQFTLVARYIPSASIKLNGGNTAVIGRGTYSDVTIEIVGEGELELFVGNVKYSGNEYAFYKDAMITNLSEPIITPLGTINKYVYTATLYVGVGFEIPNNDETNNSEFDNAFTIVARVKKQVNGQEEVRETNILIRVLDFVVSGISLTGSSSDVFDAYVDLNKTLSFDYDITLPTTITPDEAEEAHYQRIINSIDDFKLQEFNTSSSHITIAYGNGNTNIFSPTSNSYLKFEKKFLYGKYTHSEVTGIKSGSVSMNITVSYRVSQHDTFDTSFNFTINVLNYSTNDLPITIATADDFLSIFDNTDAQHYILTNDITIYNHTAINDTDAVLSLDGNNKIITIASFEINNEEQALNLALFNTISETTIIKNVTIDYSFGSLNEFSNPAQFASINYAGLAVENNGVVTNTQVLAKKPVSSLSATRGLIIPQATAQSTEINMAGFVISNNGAISNSKVGGDVFTKVLGVSGLTQLINLSTFILQGQDNIAGFVKDNAGTISSCSATNIRIVNTTPTNTSNTSGFVINNQNNAVITNSLVQGVSTNIFSQNEVSLTNGGIESSGFVSGFVMSNYGSIDNSMANIQLYKQTSSSAYQYGTRSSGFVYQNHASGIITSCVSYSSIMQNVFGQTYFSGVDMKNDNMNFGSIDYSYYYAPVGCQDPYKTGANALDFTSILEQGSYYGLNFVITSAMTDGVWAFTARGVKNISATSQTISVRYVNQATKAVSYVLPYVNGYEYGTEINPILITEANDFNTVFGNSEETSISKFYDSVNYLAFGNYRIIKDIDLSELTSTSTNQKLLTTNVTLTKKTNSSGALIGNGVIDGNGLTIKNIELSISNPNESQKYYGLFKAVTNGALIKNLNIEVKEVSASTVPYVGSLVGYVEDSKLINISAKGVSGSTRRVQGYNVVGGVVGYVKGSSAISNVSSDLSVYSTFTADTNNFINSNYMLASNVSYAGGIAGAIAVSDYVNPDNFNLEKVAYPQVQMLKVSGQLIIAAQNVGGIIGYIGGMTVVKDAWFCVSDGQKLTARENGVAGGIVAYSEGMISHSRIEHRSISYNAVTTATILQDEIENSVENYYNNSAAKLGVLDLFSNEYNYQTLGGLVGVQKGGFIQKSYAKVDVVNEGAIIAGGLVGKVTSVSTYLSEAFAFNDVYANNSKNIAGIITEPMVGGLIGFVDSGVSGFELGLDDVVAVNFWDKTRNTDSTKTQVYGVIGKLGNNNQSFNANFVSYTNSIPISAGTAVLPWVNKTDSNNIIEINGIYDNLNASKNAFSISSLFPATKADNVSLINKTFEISDGRFNGKDWERKSQSVLPHLSFGIQQNTFIIDSYQTASDFENIIKYPNKNFVILGNVNCSSAEVVKAMQKVYDQVTFTGTLSGTSDSELGSLPLLDNVKTSLFKYAVGAKFSNFSIENSSSDSFSLSLENADLTGDKGVLVSNAKKCSFSNLKFKDIIVTAPSDDVSPASVSEADIGILAGEAVDQCSFDDIEFENCVLLSNDAYGCQASKILGTLSYNFGFVAGKLSGRNGTHVINDLLIQNFDHEKQITNAITIDNQLAAKNIGLAVGKVEQAVLLSYTKELDENDSYKISAGISFKSLLFDASIGGCFGSAAYISSESPIKMKILTTQLDNTSNSSAKLNYGAFAGELLSGAVSNINVTTSARVSTTSCISFGGFVGKIGNMKIISNISVNPIEVINKTEGLSDTITYNTFVIENVTNNSQIGGVIGKLESNYLSIINISTNENHKLSITGVNNHVGGLIGSILNGNGILIENSINSMIIENNSNNIVGGLVGTISGSVVLKSLINSGNIICKSTIGTIGGLVGLVSKNSKPIINTCLASGDVKTIITISSENNTNLFIGGLVGNNAGNKGDLELISTYSLTTIRNKQRNESGISAIVATGNEIASTSTAYFCHQLNLAVDTNNYAQLVNKKYFEILSELKALDLVPYIKTFVQSFLLGHKLNPIQLTSKTNITSGNHYYLPKDITLCNIDQLNNVVIIGDGSVITNNSILVLKNETFVNIIDVDSILSGVVFNTYASNFDVIKKINGKAVIAEENNGYIYSCVVHGNLNCTETSDVNMVGSVVAVNNGVIGLTSTYAEVTVTGLSGESESKMIVGNFIALNAGWIYNCHSSGGVYTKEKIKEVYSFGTANENGITTDSYTIALLGRNENAKLIKVFGGTSKNYSNIYSDPQAVELAASCTNSISYNDIILSGVRYKISTSEGKLYKTPYDEQGLLQTESSELSFNEVAIDNISSQLILPNYAQRDDYPYGETQLTGFDGIWNISTEFVSVESFAAYDYPSLSGGCLASIGFMSVNTSITEILGVDSIVYSGVNSARMLQDLAFIGASANYRQVHNINISNAFSIEIANKNFNWKSIASGGSFEQLGYGQEYIDSANGGITNKIVCDNGQLVNTKLDNKKAVKISELKSFVYLPTYYKDANNVYYVDNNNYRYFDVDMLSSDPYYSSMIESINKTNNTVTFNIEYLQDTNNLFDGTKDIYVYVDFATVNIEAEIGTDTDENITSVTLKNCWDGSNTESEQNNIVFSSSEITTESGKKILTKDLDLDLNLDSGVYYLGNLALEASQEEITQEIYESYEKGGYILTTTTDASGTKYYITSVVIHNINSYVRKITNDDEPIKYYATISGELKEATAGRINKVNKVVDTFVDLGYVNNDASDAVRFKTSVSVENSKKVYTVIAPCESSSITLEFRETDSTDNELKASKEDGYYYLEKTIKLNESSGKYYYKDNYAKKSVLATPISVTGSETQYIYINNIKAVFTTDENKTAYAIIKGRLSEEEYYAVQYKGMDTKLRQKSDGYATTLLPNSVYNIISEETNTSGTYNLVYSYKKFNAVKFNNSIYELDDGKFSYTIQNVNNKGFNTPNICNATVEATATTLVVSGLSFKTFGVNTTDGNTIYYEDVESKLNTTVGFSGSFDGKTLNNRINNSNQKTITGLRQTKGDNNSFALFGLFGNLSKVGEQVGEIKNVILNNVNIISDNNYSVSRIGAICANASGGKITNCSVQSGEIKVSKIADVSTTSIGGILGYGECEISGCTNDVAVVFDNKSLSFSNNKVTNAYDNRGIVLCGGIVGFVMSGSKIENCKNTNSVVIKGNVVGAVGGVVGAVGGVVGATYDTQISNCKIISSSETKIRVACYTSALAYAGGIVGLSYVDIKITNPQLNKVDIISSGYNDRTYPNKAYGVSQTPIWKNIFDLKNCGIYDVNFNPAASSSKSGENITDYIYRNTTSFSGVYIGSSGNIEELTDELKNNGVTVNEIRYQNYVSGTKCIDRHTQYSWGLVLAVGVSAIIFEHILNSMDTMVFLGTWYNKGGANYDTIFNWGDNYNYVEDFSAITRAILKPEDLSSVIINESYDRYTGPPNFKLGDDDIG